MVANFKMSLLLAGALLALLVAPSAAGKIPNWKGNGTTIRVCTSEFTPMVFCKDRQPEAYTGYEIELFKNVSAKLGWEPSMLEWSCMEWDEMRGHLKANDGVCDIAVAGAEVTSTDASDGIVFTWPTYRNSLAILITVEDPVTYGMFSFFNAFEWQVWLVTAVTILVVPFIVWGIDWLAFRGKLPEGVDPEDAKFTKYFWESISRAMWMRNQVAISWAGNLVVTVYAFLILILFALYIGYATSNLTTALLDSQITGVSSLPGKAVGTWSDYTGKLQKYGVAPISYPWDTTADEVAMLDALKSGSIKALVLDASFLNYAAASDCDFVVVDAPFENYEQATAFPKGFNDTDLVNAYNEILTNLTAEGTIQSIADETLLPPEEATCSSGSESTAISFHQVAGLWILLAGTVGVGLILVVFHILHVRYTRPVLKRSTTRLLTKTGLSKKSFNYSADGKDVSEATAKEI